MNNTLKGADIIYIGGSDWEGPWGIHQQLMTRLAAHNRVLFIEYQYNFLYSLYKPKLFIAKNNRRRALRQVSKNIFAYAPSYTMPFNYEIRSINRLNQASLAQQIKGAAEKLSFKNYILWSVLPSAADLLGDLRQRSLLIYHLGNDILAEDISRFRRRGKLGMEAEIVKEADLIFSHTEYLMERYKEYSDKIHYLPSGVDYEYFRSTIESDSAEPADIRSSGRPRVAIVGYLDDYVYDVELMEDMIKKRPEYSFIFLGPLSARAKKISALKRFKNVIFTGNKSYREIPVYLKWVDACLIPYKVTGLGGAASPLKCYEYLASGKPVVSSAVKDILKYADVVRISYGLGEFCNNLDRALGEDSRENIDKRLETARNNSLDARAARVSSLISEKLQRPSS